MSILIKGMEMPTECRHGKCLFACLAVYQTGLICTALKEYVQGGEVPSDCPLVPVPPHGRTIDADALYAVMEKERDRIAKDYGDDDPFTQCLTKYAMSMVLSAPTILEAEDSEEKDND